MPRTAAEANDAVGPADHGVEDRADRTADDEMRPAVVEIVDADDEVVAELALHAEVHLLHHGILHGVVNNVDARRARADEGETTKRIG